MKKILALALTLIILASALCGCKKTQGESPTSSEQTVQSGENVSSDTPSKNGNSPSASSSATSGGSTQNPSDTTGGEQSSIVTALQGSSQGGATSGQPEKLKVNDEILKVIGGATYAELKQKYGEPTDVFYDEANSAVYKFKNTDVWYGFGDLNWGKELVDGIWPDVPTDKNGKWIFSKAPLPKEDAKCNAIYYCKVSDLILNLTEPIDVVDLEMYSNFVLEGNSYYPNDDEYICMYSFDGKYIAIESDSNFAISPQGEVKKIKLYSDIA